MRLPWTRRPKPDAQDAGGAAADAAALSIVSALAFPRADGPTNAAVDLNAPGPANPVPPPGGSAIRRLPALQSVAVRMVGVLVLVTLWSLAASYTFNYHGLKAILESESRDAADRSGTAIENSLLLHAASLSTLVESVRDDADLAQHMQRALPAGGDRAARVAPQTAADTALLVRAEQLRRLAGVDRIDLIDARGTALASSSAMQSAAPPAGTAVAPSLGGAARQRVLKGESVIGVETIDGRVVIRAVGPLLRPGDSVVVGAVAAEFALTRGFLRDMVSAGDVEVTVLGAGGTLVRTSPAASQHVRNASFAQWAGATLPAEIELAPGHLAMARPVRVGETSLVLVVHEPIQTHAPTLSQAGRRMMLFALLTVFGAVLLGLLMTRGLIRPIQALTARAEELSLRHAGRAVSRAGSEFDRMLRAFDAMTEALLAHSERLKKAHLNELQNSLELQRQYALMRLLRGLAIAANESESVEQILRSALQEVGEYLDWPIGRVALLPQDVHPDSRPPDSFWFVRNRERFAPFIEESESRPIVRSVNGLLGRAYVSGLPHWVGDLSRLVEWRRRDAALAVGLQSGVVIPVTAHGHVTAFIEFFSEHRVEATVEMLELIEAISSELSRVAERHRAERELRASEADARRTALVAAHTSSLVNVCDAQGRIEWVNASFLRVTGYTRDEVIGKLAPELLRGPGSDPAAGAMIDECLRSGQAVKNIEIVNYAKDGTPYWVDVEIQPVFNSAGALTNFVAIENDITRRKNDERRLATSASHFQALFEDSPVPALIQGPDHKLTHANRALARMLGTTPESLIGRDPNAFTHPDDIGPAIQLRRFFERKVGEAIEFERRYVRSDGAVVWARVHCVRLVPEGADPYVVAVLENFTDIKAKEHALREARDVAEAASRAKSQFLANMSHEIRTPMNGVLGMTELLLGTPLTDRQKRFAEAVYRSGEALLDIINDILDLSKIEAGRLELDTSDFSVRAMVEDVFELLAPRAHQKQIELAYRVAAGVPAALAGDPLRLRQVLTNLVGNAIKFTERGEVVLEVGVVEATARRVRLRFSVRDTGMGMKPEAVQRLFGVFMQADQSMSRRYGGSGLGLAISKHLVELMGGAITVDSRLGEGSTFRFEVPLARGNEAALPASHSSPVARELLAGRRILIVDDNPTNRSILDEHLRGEGMECACAESGMTALEMLRAAAGAGVAFDIALVDLKMPLMDGVTLARQIRDDERIAGVRLVMLTSLASGSETQAAQQAGIEICLIKPVRQQQMVQAIATLLAPKTANAVVPALREASVRLAGTRVLLVEDNSVNQELARAMLQGFGCAVRLAGDGREALDALSREVFDAVLMDCQMPEMDGFEAVRLFRSGNVGRPTLATAADAPVIALTANALPGDAERCRAAGFTDYLPKPFRQAQLAEMLARHVRRGAAATVAAEPAPPPSPAAVIDVTVIERIRDMERRGAARLLVRLIDTYLETSDRLIADLEKALADGDSRAARQAAHTLKSSSANLGANEFSGRCADIEHLARGGQIVAASEAWPVLAQAHARATARLRELAQDSPRIEPVVCADRAAA